MSEVARCCKDYYSRHKVLLFTRVSGESLGKCVKDAQANTVSRQKRTEKALFGRFARSKIHERGTPLQFSDSLLNLSEKGL